METKEKILTPADKFLQSKEYLDLKKEVKESVKQALANEEDEDIEPLIRLFDKQISGHYPDAVSREKMFWEIVAENLKDNVFENIYKDIWNTVEEGAYAEIEPIINKKLSEAIKKLSPTIFRVLNKRGFALIVLKDKFYDYLPEVSALLMGATEGRKQKTKIPSGKFVERQEQDWIDAWAEAMEEEPSKYPRMLKEKTWDVPDLQEIKPGLILEIENIEHDYKQNMEVISSPYEEKEDWAVMVKVKTASQEEYVKKVFLADIGIIPYQKNQWNGWNRPIKWYPKEKSEK